MKTSETDPIRVDFLAAADLGLPGFLGLTLAPGKKDSDRRMGPRPGKRHRAAPRPLQGGPTRLPHGAYTSIVC